MDAATTNENLSKSIITPLRTSVKHKTIRGASKDLSTMSPLPPGAMNYEYSDSNIRKQDRFDFKRPSRHLPTLNLSYLSNGYPNKEEMHTYQKGKKMIDEALEAKCKVKKAPT